MVSISLSSLFSHPLTAVMIRRDNAMTSRHASNLQRRGMGPRYARGEGIWGGGEVQGSRAGPQQMRPYEPTTDWGGACRLHRKRAGAIR